MKWADLKGKLKDKGVTALHELSEEDFAAVGEAMGIGPADLVKMAREAARDEFEAQAKASAERQRQIQAGAIPDNGVPGSGNKKDTSIVYGDRPLAELASFLAPSQVGTMVKVPRIDRAGDDVKAWLGEMESEARRGRTFRFESSLSAATTQSDPSNVGIKMPAPFEQAMVDTYIAASGWLDRTRKITGPGDRFWYPVRKRKLSTTERQKSMTNVEAKIIGEDSVPKEVTNTAWGYAEGKALRMACYGKITAAALRGFPNALNDFIVEMGRGINDHAAYYAGWGLGPASNEPLGFINQVDADYAPIEVARNEVNKLKRADLRAMVKKLHTYHRSGGPFFMGQDYTYDLLGDEVDDQKRPIWNEWRASISAPIEPTTLLGYGAISNWQSPLPGQKGDVVLIDPRSLWTFFQEGVSFRSTDQIEFLQGNLHVVAEVGYNCGVVAGLNTGLVVLKATT